MNATTRPTRHPMILHRIGDGEVRVGHLKEQPRAVASARNERPPPILSDADRHFESRAQVHGLLRRPTQALQSTRGGNSAAGSSNQ